MRRFLDAVVRMLEFKKLIEENILPANQVVTFAPFEIKQSGLNGEPVATIIKH